MQIIIPNTFDNYTEEKTYRGIERTSTTIYKGYRIYLNAYASDGIMCIVSKGSKIIASERYSSINPETLLQWAKNMVDARRFTVSIYCKLFHRKFIDEQYSSFGRPIRVCLKCNQKAQS